MQRKLIHIGSLLVASAIFFGTGTSLAGSRSHDDRGRRHHHYDHSKKKRHGHHRGKDAPAVPELGAAGATSAIALMLGVGLILVDRRRRAPSTSAR